MPARTQWILVALVVFLAAASGRGAAAEISPTPLVLATTTSTYDTGLLDVLLPLFEKLEPQWKVQPIAVGTGQALALGRRGEADVLLVHAPAAELRFMEEGHGLSRLPVMHNDFVLLGPPADPAGIRGLGAPEALGRIARGGFPFVSRGDDSGTHKREKALVKEAGLKDLGTGVVETGAGMAHSLRVADELGAYVLADRGTFLSLRHGLRLIVLAEGDEGLRNPYSVIVVRPKEEAGTPAQRGHRLIGARRFAAFLRRDPIQQRIRRFGLRKYGQVLFHPDAMDGDGRGRTR